jgi:hypothetical protein
MAQVIEFLDKHKYKILILLLLILLWRFMSQNLFLIVAALVLLYFIVMENKDVLMEQKQKLLQ